MTTSTAPATRPEKARRASAASRREAGARSGSSAGHALTNKQKASLAQTARIAWDVQSRAGFTDGYSFDEWRRAEQNKAVGVSSLTLCGNNHYRPLLAHFLTLAGKEVPAFRTWVRTGRVTGHGDLDDTHENREAQRHLILQAVIDHGNRCDPAMAHASFDPVAAAQAAEKGGIITAAYVTKIALGKCRSRGLASLTAAQLRQILYTTRNRIAAREGRGDAKTRNSKQRRTTAP